jgi:LemA protein
MKKWIFPGILVVLALWAFGAGKGFYNSAVNYQENAKNQWAKVESAYQRRTDLIPSLVNTVKGYAAHEKETLEGVIKARAEATKTTIDANDLTPEKMAAFQKAQSGLSGALSKLMVVVERYPDLKANQNFLELQSQLEGTENRIKVERDRFNDEVSIYSKHLKVFPNNIFNMIFKFEEMGYFKSDEGAAKAPKVEF